MTDLIEQFFKRDLTEAEENALAESLRSDDGSAGKFGRSLDEAYARTGLPDPGGSGPEGPAEPSNPTGAGPWILGGVGIAILACMGWVAFQMVHTCPVPAAQVAPMTAPAPVEVESAEPKVRPGRPKGVERAMPANQAFKLVKVVVNQASEGPVSVIVVGPKGNLVQNLYQGDLKSGKWSFGWDGRRLDGSAVSAGTYTVEIHTALGLQSREVVVK